MGKLLKVLKIIGITLLVLIVVLVIGRNVIVPIGAGIGVKAMTGLTLKMDKFNIGLFSTKLDIEGLKIYNPKGYQDPLMLDVPKIYVDYDLTDIIGGNIHLYDVKFFLTEFVLVKQADGSSNLDGIMKLASKKTDKPAVKEEPKAGEKKKAPEIQIDLLELKVGKFVSKSYNEAGKADVKTITLNIDERYESKSIAAIAASLNKYVGKVLLQMTMNLGLNDISGALGGTLGSVGELGLGTAQKGVDIGKGAVDEAGKVLKGTTDGLKNLLPFGK